MVLKPPRTDDRAFPGFFVNGSKPSMASTMFVRQKECSISLRFKDVEVGMSCIRQMPPCVYEWFCVVFLPLIALIMYIHNYTYTYVTWKEDEAQRLFDHQWWHVLEQKWFEQSPFDVRPSFHQLVLVTCLRALWTAGIVRSAVKPRLDKVHAVCWWCHLWKCHFWRCQLTFFSILGPGCCLEFDL